MPSPSRAHREPRKFNPIPQEPRRPGNKQWTLHSWRRRTNFPRSIKIEKFAGRDHGKNPLNPDSHVPLLPLTRGRCASYGHLCPMTPSTPGRDRIIVKMKVAPWSKVAPRYDKKYKRDTYLQKKKKKIVGLLNAKWVKVCVEEGCV